MNRLIFAALILATALAARADFTFIHISDIHVGAGNNAETDEVLFTEMAARDVKPVFIVNTGDVCENGTTEQYDRYQQILARLANIPSYVAPGNHDVRWNPMGKEGYTSGAKQPLYQSWDYQNVHFVTLDSTVLLEHWGHISQEQLDWLKKDLEKIGPDKPLVIGFHHWIGRDPVMVDNEQALMDLVAPYNVVLWLQGHGHSDIQWNINGVPAIMVKGLYQGSYNIIDVTDKEMKISKRFQPDTKRELTKSEDEPPTSAPAAQHRAVMTIPLKKQPAPEWTVENEGSATKPLIVAHAEKLPKDSILDYRIDGEKLARMKESSIELDTAKLSPGIHTVTVQATLPDGRAFQIPKEIKIPGAVSPIWEANVGGAIQSRLVRDGDLLYVTTMGNDLVALLAATGKEKFRVHTAGPIFCAPHVDNGVVYFASADHFVYAYDALSGREKWKTQLGGAVLAGPNVAQGIVCVGSVDTKIYGLDAISGSIVWTVQGMNMYQTKTATDGQRFFVGGWDNHFRCIDAKEGKLLWDVILGRPTKAKNFSPYAPAITSPAVGGGKVYCSTNDGILHALNIEDHAEAWHIDWKKMGYSSPIFVDGKVYCALSDEGKTFRADPATGHLDWTCETGAVIYDSSFCYAGGGGGGNVFIGNVNGTLNAINAASGKIEYQYRLGPGHLLGSPIADDEKVYVGNMTGKIVALPVHATQPTAQR
jgi:hypothetical protein